MRFISSVSRKPSTELSAMLIFTCVHTVALPCGLLNAVTASSRYAARAALRAPRAVFFQFSFIIFGMSP